MDCVGKLLWVALPGREARRLSVEEVTKVSRSTLLTFRSETTRLAADQLGWRMLFEVSWL